MEELNNLLFEQGQRYLRENIALRNQRDELKAEVIEALEDITAEFRSEIKQLRAELGASNDNV